MYKKIGILFILKNIFIVLVAQESKTLDSLQHLFNKTNDLKTKFDLLLELNSESHKNIEKAIDYCLKAQKIAKSLNNKSLISLTHRKLGNTYFSHSLYEKAIGCYSTSLKIAESIKDSVSMANCLNNIGNVYAQMATFNNPNLNYSNALRYHNQALKIRIEKKDNNIKNSLLNLSTIYDGMGDSKKAMALLSQALDEYVRINDPNGVRLVYLNLSSLHLKQFEISKKKKHLIEAKKCLSNVFKNSKISKHYCEALRLQGDIYFIENNIEEAKKSYLKSIESAEEYNNNDDKKDAVHGLYKSFASQMNYQKALEYYKLYLSLKETIYNQNIQKQMSEMNIKYESEKKEKDIQLLTKDKKLQETEIEKQKLVKNLFIIGFVIAILVAFIVLRLFRATKKQKLIIEHQNEQIVESINYSKRIQNSLLPSVAEMKKNIPDVFVLYEPKNIVSGDLYYFKQFENYSILACVDCTGHGVPGGFMSTVGSLLLDKIVNDSTLKPSEILIQLNNEIIRMLHQQAGGELQDGMDLSVCLIDKINSSIEYSGARNGIIVVTNNEAKRYKANPLPVGGNYMKKGVPVERNFKTESITLNSSDWVFMHTDGFIEQIGGTENDPMNYKQFEKHLIDTITLNTDLEKITFLKSKLAKWSGNNEQTDDVLVIGFKVV